jgi:hypothetical protein
MWRSKNAQRADSPTAFLRSLARRAYFYRLLNDEETDAALPHYADFQQIPYTIIPKIPIDNFIKPYYG